MSTKPTNRKFNVTLARAYGTTKGFWSVDIGPEEFDAIQQVEVGGRLSLKIIPEESRKDEKSPHAYFEYITAEVNKANKDAFKNKKGQAPTPRAKQADSSDDL